MKHREKTTAAACADAHGGCGHDGCGCHCHGHGHEGGKARLWWPLVSFVMLVVGVVASAAGWAWFAAPWVPAVWYAAAFLSVGLPVAHEAWEAARQKDVFSEFTLMVLAAVGAFCIGEYAEAVAVMLFYTVGEALQHRAVDSATRNIGRLLDVRPERAAVLRGGRYVEVKPVEVKPGEVIEVKPGGRVPLDGALTDDGAAFDTSALTGESLPRNVVKGGEVLAGMIASGQTVHVRVSRPYEQSALARILTLVRDASSRKAPAELFIRRFARVYTPAVIVAAALVVVVPALVSLLVPSFRYVFDEWLYRGLVFLVLSCPCALVMGGFARRYPLQGRQLSGCHYPRQCRGFRQDGDPYDRSLWRDGGAHGTGGGTGCPTVLLVCGRELQHAPHSSGGRALCCRAAGGVPKA